MIWGRLSGYSRVGNGFEEEFDIEISDDEAENISQFKRLLTTQKQFIKAVKQKNGMNFMPFFLSNFNDFRKIESMKNMIRRTTLK